MSTDQLTEHETQHATEAAGTGQTKDDIQGLPPHLYSQARRIGPGDVQGLRDLLTLFPDFARQILAVVSPHAGLSTVKRAQALVQGNAVGKGGALADAQFHEGGEFALEGSAATSHDRPDAKPLSNSEQAAILHDRSDAKPLSNSEQAAILHDRSDAKPRLHDVEPTQAMRHDAQEALVDDLPGVRRYNAAHADLVAQFNRYTHNVCCDVDAGDQGVLDPAKVARWQSQHGLTPDGKVGPHTVAAAKHAPAVASNSGPDARPDV